MQILFKVWLQIVDRNAPPPFHKQHGKSTGQEAKPADKNLEENSGEKEMQNVTILETGEFDKEMEQSIELRQDLPNEESRKKGIVFLVCIPKVLSSDQPP